MGQYRVRLPIWKSYLYSLAQRYRRYLWLNKGMIEFGMTSKEVGILNSMLHKYLRKEVLRQVKAVQYEQLVKIVLGSKLAIATKEEIQVANKLFVAYKIKTGDLIMELKQLKAFAAEVGLAVKQIKGLDEDELTMLILQTMDADKAYSDEFVEWYDDLPEELFDNADAIEEEKPAKGKGKKGKKEEKEEEVDYSDLIEAINDAEDTDELIEIAQDEDFEEIFAEVDTDIKLVKKLKKAMLAAIEEFQNKEEEEEEEEEEKLAKKTKPAKEEKAVKAKPAKEEKVVAKGKAKPAKEDDNSDLAEAINDASDAEELKEVADSVKEDNPELFKGISFRQGRGKSPFRTDVKAIKKEMLSRLDTEEADNDEDAELDVTAELVNDAVDNEDKEALQEMCAALEIKLSPLEKRSITKMQEKLLDKLPKSAKKTDKKTDKGVKGKKEKVAPVEEETEESKSIYQIVEEMFLEGEDTKAIANAVTPVLSERGKNKVQILKWVKQMVAVVEAAMSED